MRISHMMGQIDILPAIRLIFACSRTPFSVVVMWLDWGVVPQTLGNRSSQFDHTALRKACLLDAQTHEPKRVVKTIDFALTGTRRPFIRFASLMRQESLTPEDFNRLLQWLDSNPEQAALKYETTRIRLITFFAGGNCGCDAERLADEAFDRVSQKLKAGQVSESHGRDKTFYFLGFARNIRHEYHRQPRPAEINDPVIGSNGNNNNEDMQEEFECLDECMDELTKENRSLVIEYYHFEKSAKIEHRRKIANQLGIDVKALRLRIYRIREQLKPCIENCLNAPELRRNALVENNNNN